MSEQSKILIIGAGISGLLAGKLLSQAGLEVKILEKSRGVGGRMATRRFQKGIFDHGAQFFTVKDQGFESWVEQWERAGAAQVWARGFPSSADNLTQDGHPRYIGVRGMTSVPKLLSAGLDVALQFHVSSVSRDGKMWVVKNEAGEAETAGQLILTAPVPQSLDLLRMGGVSLPQGELEVLEGIHYQPCIALLVLLEGPSEIPAPGGMQFDSGPIRWLGDNSQKGISPEASAVTVHASADFSQENFDMDPDQLVGPLIEAAKPWLGEDIQDWQLHRWRYSQPAQTYPQYYLEVPGLPGLYMVGDAFGGARVEGAALSGIAVAQYLSEK